MLRVVLHREDLHSRGYQYADAALSCDEARGIINAGEILQRLAVTCP